MKRLEPRHSEEDGFLFFRHYGFPECDENAEIQDATPISYFNGRYAKEDAMQEKQIPLFDNLPPANIKKKMPQSLGPPSRPMGYNKYILSPEWKKKREKAFRLLGRKCSRCNSTVGLEVHHKTYNHLYKETSADVDILCSKCHPSADSERKIETAFGTYLSTKYGDYAQLCDEEREYEEFRDWLERKQEL